VLSSDVDDHLPVERLAGAGVDAALVEDAGDMLVGVIVEQFVDGCDDVWWGLAELVGVSCVRLPGTGFSWP